MRMTKIRKEQYKNLCVCVFALKPQKIVLFVAGCGFFIVKDQLDFIITMSIRLSTL